MKRMYINTLPLVLCIQQKRYFYDWEANWGFKLDDFFKVSITEMCQNR